MTIRLYARATCDGCGAEIDRLPASGTLTHLRFSHRWERVRGPGPRERDFCPACRAQAVLERALAEAARLGLEVTVLPARQLEPGTQSGASAEEEDRADAPDHRKDSS